jgi:DNA-binding transcriptional LysR family regulator
MLAWDDLQTLLAVHRHRTLSAAARALGVRQSTMGRRLEALHQRAGMLLLLRTPAGYEPNEAGARLLVHAEAMEAQALAAQRAVSGADNQLTGEVRIASVEAFAARILVPAMAGLAMRYPAIRVEIDVDTRSLSLARRETDIAVRLAAFQQHETVVRQAGAMAFAVYASPDYLQRTGQPDWAAGAPGHRLVTLQPTLLDTPEGRWFSGAASAATAVLATNSREGQLVAVRAGVGMGCLPRYLGDADESLVRLETGGAAPVRPIMIGVHRDLRHVPRIRAVLDHLRGTIEAARPALSPA